MRNELRGCLKIPNLTPKSPLYAVERGTGGEVKGKNEVSDTL
jgi:hypothetical protein